MRGVVVALGSFLRAVRLLTGPDRVEHLQSRPSLRPFTCGLPPELRSSAPTKDWPPRQTQTRVARPCELHTSSRQPTTAGW